MLSVSTARRERKRPNENSTAGRSCESGSAPYTTLALWFRRRSWHVVSEEAVGAGLVEWAACIRRKKTVKHPRFHAAPTTQQQQQLQLQQPPASPTVNANTKEPVDESTPTSRAINERETPALPSSDTPSAPPTIHKKTQRKKWRRGLGFLGSPLRSFRCSSAAPVPSLFTAPWLRVSLVFFLLLLYFNESLLQLYG